MDYKKEYKYALARAKAAVKECGDDKDRIAMVESIFPELKGPDDERIIKFLKHAATLDAADELFQEYGVKHTQVIAWLNKQGKQKPAPQWMIDFLDADCRMNLGTTLDRDVYREMEGKLIAIKEFLEDQQRGSAFEEANGEEIDNADEIKPKFKIGDWVVANIYGLRSPLKIVDASDIEYRIEDTDGNSDVPKIDYLDRHYRLWDPQDAKDGDVLVTETSHKPFIFKGFLDVNHPFAPVAYCGIERWNMFYISSDPNWWTDDSFIPASAQEREQLFNAMHEKGYGWDPDRKKLEITDWSKHIKYDPNGPSPIAVESADEAEPTLNTHPKFKVGDWIVHDMSDGGSVIRRIIGMTDEHYILDGEGFNTFYFNDIENDYHLWTIDDVKDGDVLVASDGSIFIFKSVVDSACKYYVALTVYNDIKINTNVEGGYWEMSKAVRPATKEQRDLLFKAIKEAGYEWDPDKKKLEITDWSKHITSKIDEPSGITVESADEDKHFLEIHPKFKVGDKIVIKDVIGEVQITEITDGMYGTITQFGIHLFFDINVLDREAHYATK